MLKKNIIAVLCTLFMAMPTFANNNPFEKKTPLISKAIVGGLIGAVEGIACHYLEQHLLEQLVQNITWRDVFIAGELNTKVVGIKLISWAITASIRDGILSALQAKDDSSFAWLKSAQIASWYSYLSLSSSK